MKDNEGIQNFCGETSCLANKNAMSTMKHNITRYLKEKGCKDQRLMKLA
jgi:hypothetical protein